MISIRLTGVCAFCIFCVHLLVAQQDPTWDNTAKTAWSTAFQQVQIPSSADGTLQQAYFFKSTQKHPQPLIVSLHTWSGDYQQRDPMTNEILARDWNYIHPNFRGANNKPESMGSSSVLSDIKDAIEYAIKNGNVDPADVHVIGVSGGGYATLFAYMRLDYPVKSFSAWAPISDIEAWYWESIGRRQKYADDIVAALGGTFDDTEARRRSPIFQDFPKEKRQNASLYIYEGIHDGYTGSVPITHSLNMYNRLAAELKYKVTDLDSIGQLARLDNDLVSANEIIDLLTKRTLPLSIQPEKDLFGRQVYLEKSVGTIHLTIFEGGHEQLPQALSYIPVNDQVHTPYHILTIGDSNGQLAGGWVDQLQNRLPHARIINISQSGRTIGFDNGGREELNALKNIDNYLAEGQRKSDHTAYDFIIVCLGTNDAKYEFRDRQQEVLENFSALLRKIRKHRIATRKTRLLCISPPPIREKDIENKYVGGNERLAKLVPQLKAKAIALGFEFVDVYHPLLGVSDYYAKDGVHMAAAGQAIIANSIVSTLEQQ